MEKYCDLHTHSVFSDGTYTPSEIVDAAEEAGLSAVALTDHNTTLGLDEFLSASRGRGVFAIAGIELSTEWRGKELHIVSLFLPRESFRMVEDMLAERNEMKKDANRRLVAALRADGYQIDYDEIARHTEGYINRAHIARALMEMGYVSSIKEAFSTLLAEGRGYYVPPSLIDACDGIEFLKSAGSVTVLAHPFLNLSESELEAFLPIAKERGLDAIETHYSLFSEEETAIATQKAYRYELYESGGSDFHGNNKPDIAIGRGRGEMRVPYTFVTKLESLISK